MGGSLAAHARALGHAAPSRIRRRGNLATSHCRIRAQTTRLGRMLQEQDSDVEKRGSGPASIDSVENHGIGDRKVAVSLASASPDRKVRTYWWRWLVLAIFSLNLCFNTWIWIMAAPVADVFRCYYNVTNFMVNALTLCYCVVYVIFAIPSAFFLGRYGLRVIMIFAISMSAFGTALRVIGTGK